MISFQVSIITFFANASHFYVRHCSSFLHHTLIHAYMKLVLKIITSLLLLVNGTGAVYGGLSFMLHPDGSGLQMDIDWLKHSPFNDFFIPGLILFVANGLFSFSVLALLLFNHKKYWLLVFTQGVVLTGWIVIQILMLQEIVPLHVIMGAVGIALIPCGLFLFGIERNDQEPARRKN